MKNKSAPSLKNIDVIFLSFFGVGFCPIAPGTAGTIATLPILYALGQYNIPIVFIIPFIIITTIISSFLSDWAQRKYKTHDPSWIVIDETLGIIVAWLFVQSNNWVELVVITILFRIFDIYKIWPASYFDKKVKHGAGIILDDLISGIYAGLVFLLLKLLV